MNQVYNELLMKKQQNEILVQQGKRKYEYDSGTYYKKIAVKKTPMQFSLFFLSSRRGDWGEWFFKSQL